MKAIKNTKMPSDCYDCDFAKNKRTNDYGSFCECGLLDDCETINLLEHSKPSDCPLVEVVTCKDCKYKVFLASDNKGNTIYMCDKHWKNITDEDFYCSDGERFKEYIKALPPITPTQRWIPCSERLPEPKRLVLCYITTGATETYFLALWNDTLNAWEEGIGGYRLLEKDLGYEVIAWQPLPEPYKAESEDKE